MLAVSLLLLGGWTAMVAATSQYVGMNIAGFEFGCDIEGNCPLASIKSPVGVAPAQMKHFVNDDGMNIFRLPVSWQFLVNNVVGATLFATNLAKYDGLIQDCLKTGAYCAIDIHNFARFDGKIIGQGGPTDAQFADLWTQLATKYKSESKILFGLMNEPHDLDILLWANSVQAAVTAIRKAGATSQMILLPGTNFASAGKFVSSGSGDALVKVTNPDGSVDGLIFDLHKYLDIDNSGNFPDCVTNNIDDAFAIVATFLKGVKRQALVSETGAGNKATSCFTDFCAQNTFLNQNSDVFLGYIAWAAGSFDNSYILGLVPTETGGKLVDTPMASQCVLGPWLSAGGGVSVASGSKSSTAAAATTTSDKSQTSKSDTTGTATATATATTTSKNTASQTTSVSGASTSGSAASATTTSKKSSTSTAGSQATTTTSTSSASFGLDKEMCKWILTVASILALAIY